MNIKEKIKEQFNRKSFRLGGYSVLISIIVIAIAVFVVMTVDSLSSKYTKPDMTSASLYSLSEESINIAHSVNKDVTIYMLAQSGYEDKLTQTIIEKYSGYNDKIKVELKDPIVFPNFAKQYTSESIQNNSLIVVCGEKSRYIPSSDIYKTTTDYSTYTQNTEFDAENQITSALSFVISEDLPKIYYTSGHGEEALSSQTLSDIKKQNIDTEEIGLLTLSQIPEDADLILINNPQSDISSAEKDLLLSYLKSGGSMILITGYNGVEMPVLNELMRNYKVERENKLVFEGNANMTVGGYPYFLVPDMISTKITDPLINEKYAVLLPLAHPIKVLDNSDSSAIAIKILNTSSAGYTKSNAESMENLQKQAGDEEGKYSVGVTITDTVEKGETKIAWFSSAHLLSDNINQMVSGGNRDLFLNAVNWICDREEGIAIHAKSLQSEALTIPTGIRNMWSIIFVFIIPILFIAAGIYVLYKRRIKKND